MLDLSVVVCSYNDKRIENLINSIDEDCEIVVVCNGSDEAYLTFVKLF